MLKDFFWRTFENTGNIDNYMFFKELSNFENQNNEIKQAKNESATGFNDGGCN
ncbi:MAG: YqzL family protein [Bacteroidales bacterium]|nr:YqzL family protein [Bacteroidales bacterium]